MIYELAQLNIARKKYDDDDPRFAGFMDHLDRINALGDAAPGAIWRFEIAEQGAGSRLRFSMTIGKENNGTAPRALRDPLLENDVLFERRLIHKANMQRVVEGVRELVDGPANDDRR